MRKSHDVLQALNQFRNNQDLQLHLQLLEHYQNIIANAPLIKAAVLLGSFAQHRPDRLSDIDLVVFTMKENLRSTFTILWDRHLHSVIHEWKKEFSESHIFGKGIYDNFLSIEIHVLSTENGFRLREPMIILKDDGILLSQRMEPGEPPKHEDFEALAGGVDGLGWELFDMLKWWQRGKSELVKTHLKKIVEKLGES